MSIILYNNTSGDLTVRIWDIDTNDNYILPITLKQYSSEDRGHQVSEMFTCLAFSKAKQTLCAGTNVGRIYFWSKKQSKSNHDNLEETWDLNNINSVSGTIKQIIWSSATLRLPLLSVNCVTKVYIMKEQSLCTCFSEKIWATQKNANEILLETVDANFVLRLDMQVTDMSINEHHIAFTNGRVIEIHESIWKNNNLLEFKEKKDDTPKLNTKLISTFNCDNESLLVYKRNVITLFINGVTIRSLNGIIEASISAVSSEGEPIGMDVCGNYLTIFTLDGFLKIYDLSEREPKMITAVRNLYDMCNDFGEIIQAKINSAGNKVALTLAATNLIPDGKLYVWDIENDNMMMYDFKKNSNHQIYEYDDYEETETKRSLDAEENGDDTKVVFDKICMGRIPLFLYWDFKDPRLLVCDAKRIKISNQKIGFGKLVKPKSGKYFC